LGLTHHGAYLERDVVFGNQGMQGQRRCLWWCTEKFETSRVIINILPLRVAKRMW